MPALVVGDAGGQAWTPAAQWLGDADEIDALLAYQRSFTPDLDAKGQAAYAIGDYSHMVASAFVPLMVGHRLVPDFSPAGIEIGFDTKPMEHRGRTVTERLARLRLVDPAFHTDDAALAENPSARWSADLAGVFRGHVEALHGPLVAALNRKSGLSRNALWRLVGDSFSQLFLDAGRRFGRIDQAKGDAMAVLKAPGSPLTNRQMHYFDIELRNPADPGRVLACVTYRARGGCCRFYTVEGGHLCTTCVLQDPGARDALLEERLRRRLGLAAAPVAFENPSG